MTCLMTKLLSDRPTIIFYFTAQIYKSKMYKVLANGKALVGGDGKVKVQVTSHK